MIVKLMPETYGIEIKRAIWNNSRKQAFKHDRKKSLKYVLYCRKNAKNDPEIWGVAYLHYRDKHLTEYRQIEGLI